MRFREWFLEMSGVKDMDVSHINLSPLHARFDTYPARDRCQDKVREQEFYKGIYDYPEQDPDLDVPEDEDEQEAYMNKWYEIQREKKREIQPQVDEFLKQCMQEEEQEFRSKMPNRGYKYNFNIDGKDYVASFYRVSEQNQYNDGSFSKIVPYIGTIPNTFNIEFEGPAGYSLTRQEGGGATKIYTQLLLAAKKLMESEKVNALYFSPADTAMALMYKKFYDQFLANDFIQPGKNMYIRKSFLKERLAKLPPEQQKLIYSQILSGNRDIRAGLKNINQRKVAQRNIMMNARQYVGKVVGYKISGQVMPMYIKRIVMSDYDGPQAAGLILSGPTLINVNWALTPDNPNEGSRITDTSTIDPEIMKRFNDALQGATV